MSKRTNLLSAAMAALTFGLTAATHPAIAKDRAVEATPATSGMPVQMVGEWFEGSVGPTTYWDRQTGAYRGSGRQMGSILRVNADGSYERFVYLYVRTYDVVTEVWTSYRGTATVEEGRLTLRPTSGHYKTGGSGRKVDRDMTAEELEKAAASYDYAFERDGGRTLLVLPFADGSAYRYRRTDEDAAKRR